MAVGGQEPSPGLAALGGASLLDAQLNPDALLSRDVGATPEALLALAAELGHLRAVTESARAHSSFLS